MILEVCLDRVEATATGATIQYRIPLPTWSERAGHTRQQMDLPESVAI